MDISFVTRLFFQSVWPVSLLSLSCLELGANCRCVRVANAQLFSAGFGGWNCLAFRQIDLDVCCQPWSFRGYWWSKVRAMPSCVVGSSGVTQISPAELKELGFYDKQLRLECCVCDRYQRSPVRKFGWLEINISVCLCHVSSAAAEFNYVILHFSPSVHFIWGCKVYDLMSLVNRRSSTMVV